MLIAHPTALEGVDETAFAHAVLLAVRGGANLASIHASADPAGTKELPRAGLFLKRWGLPEGEVSHECVFHTLSDDPADTLLEACRRLKPDLVVAATHARTGIDRVLGGSVIEGLARNLEVPTLLLPIGGRGFVDLKTGAVALERMLVPAGNLAEAERAVGAAVALARLAQVEESEIVLLHVGSAVDLPRPEVPRGFTLLVRTASGPLEAAICETAQELEVGLVVMATHGHDSLLDVILGSHTERVLHELGRPLLWVPLAAAG